MAKKETTCHLCMGTGVDKNGICMTCGTRIGPIEVVGTRTRDVLLVIILILITLAIIFVAVLFALDAFGLREFALSVVDRL